MSKQDDIPTSWVWTTLGDVVEINPGLDISPLPDETLVSFIPMPAVEAETGRIDTTDTRQLSEVRRGYTPFQEGDVLFAKITPSMENGKSAVTQALPYGIGFGSTEFHVLRPVAGVEAKFVHNYVVRKAFRQTARGHMKGSAGQLRVPADYLKSARFPLPPVNEQRRIVAAIEEQFSRLNAGVTALEQVQASLKRYRTALLKVAVEGKLTKAWRTKNPNIESASRLLERILKERRRRWEEEQRAAYERKGNKPPKNWQLKYKEPALLDTEALPKLPKGWCWAGMEALSQLITSGSRGWAQYYSDHGAAFIRMGNLDHETVTLDLSHVQRVDPPAGAEGTRTRVQQEDILVSITAELGMVGLASRDLGEAYINQHVALVRPVDESTGKFLAWYLASQDGKRQLQSLRRGATKTGLGLDDIRAVKVPLPSVAEQERIVEEIERRLLILQQVETEVEANLRRAAQLRQSILKQAFEGKLVPQDPYDEPAATLLMRVREERTRREQQALLAKRSKRKKSQGTRERRDVKSEKTRRPLQQVLFEVSEPLKPEELLDRAGFKSESIEDFYVELREEVRSNRVEELRPNNKDVYLRAVKE